MPALPIPSPYNFVPLSEHVFFPDWSAQVSQDVPFLDGISGWFDIEVEATTPLFIRHGKKPVGWDEQTPDEVNRLREHWLQPGPSGAPTWPEDEWIEFFRAPDKRFSIPGTSLKGELREVLEAASFGKFARTDGSRILRKADRRRGTPDIRQRDVQHRSQSGTHFATQWDLAETIFGRAEQTGSHRGRVVFGPLQAHFVPDSPRPVIWPVLQTPKGMFAPNYAEQPFAGGETGWTSQLVTWSDPKSRLRGWKRYPRTRIVRPCLMPPEKHGRVRWELSSPMRTLPAGTRFRGRVHVHNLCQKELGALLWAIGLGEDIHLPAKRRRYWHALGAAKPFGYGSVSISVLDAPALLHGRGKSTLELQGCLKNFIDLMEAFHSEGSWLNSPQLRALHAMADPDTKWPMRLEYPTFDDFQDYADTNDHALLPAVPYQPSAASLPRRETSPPPPVAPAQPLPDLTGRKVEARLKTRDGAEAVFKFQADGREHTGMPVPDLRPTFRKTLASGRVYRFQIAGLPDTAGRYPLALPEE